MKIIEILEDVAASVKSAREVLAAKELELRNTMPSVVDLRDPYGLTSEDAADFMSNAQGDLTDALETLGDLISAANARSLNIDEDKEVEGAVK